MNSRENFSKHNGNFMLYRSKGGHVCNDEIYSIIFGRRRKVLELRSQGYSQSDIAKILQVSQSTVSRDISI